MMTVRLRLAKVLARWALKERHQDPQPVSRLAMRCWPTDLDVNRHMNNSRYLALMDVGRYHFLLVSGLWRTVLKERLSPVLVGAEISFKRSIRPGERFVLETLQGEVNNKSVRLVQRFWVGKELAAEAAVTALFLKGGRAQPLGPLLDRHTQGLEAVPPSPFPAHATLAATNDADLASR